MRDRKKDYHFKKLEEQGLVPQWVIESMKGKSVSRLIYDKCQLQLRRRLLKNCNCDGDCYS